MPFVANTPESFLDRSDSKNPSSTCAGITSAGRPCRRPIASGTASRRPSPTGRDDRLYCWQHRDQAGLSAQSSPGPRPATTAAPIIEEPLKTRSSLDTLAEKLGLLDVRERKRRQHRRASSRPGGRYKQSPPSKPKGTLDFCFCFSIPIEERHDLPVPPRPQPAPVQRPTASAAPASLHAKPSSTPATPRKSAATASQTAQLKGLIPDTLDSATASALMTELSRPYVDSEEPGYVYMFWLTPASNTAAPPVDAARSLLSPPTPSASEGRARRPSDVVSSFADGAGDSSSGRRTTMLLKIGRAANVQRRMNQWQRQCGKDIEVLRYYPHHQSSSSSPGPRPSTSSSAASPGPVMTPHVKRVERLIHIELAGMGLAAERGECGACGREHREWFEVEAQRRAVRRVDGVIKRWVRWDLGNV